MDVNEADVIIVCICIAVGLFTFFYQLEENKKSIPVAILWGVGGAVATIVVVPLAILACFLILLYWALGF